MLDLEDELMDWYRGTLDDAYVDDSTAQIKTMRQWIKSKKVSGIKYDFLRCTNICSELDALTRMSSIEIIRY